MPCAARCSRVKAGGSIWRCWPSGGEGGYTSAEEALFASGDPLLGEWLDVRISRVKRALNGMESAAEERDTSGVQAELWRLLEIRRKIS